jgi:hypothetical protein
MYKLAPVIEVEWPEHLEGLVIGTVALLLESVMVALR